MSEQYRIGQELGRCKQDEYVEGSWCGVRCRFITGDGETAVMLCYDEWYKDRTKSKVMFVPVGEIYPDLESAHQAAVEKFNAHNKLVE